MPRGDRNGPDGMGPMTGRGAGLCNGSNVPGYVNQGTAYGRGIRAGRGIRGMRNGFGAGYRGNRRFGINAAPFDGESAAGFSKEVEKGYMEAEVTLLKNQLKILEERLAGMQEDK